MYHACIYIRNASRRVTGLQAKVENAQQQQQQRPTCWHTCCALFDLSFRFILSILLIFPRPAPPTHPPLPAPVAPAPPKPTRPDMAMTMTTKNKCVVTQTAVAVASVGAVLGVYHRHVFQVPAIAHLRIQGDHDARSRQPRPRLRLPRRGGGPRQVSSAYCCCCCCCCIGVRTNTEQHTERKTSLPGDIIRTWLKIMSEKQLSIAHSRPPTYLKF